MSFCTRKLAYVIDSLVRVSRRVGKHHFGKIAEASSGRISSGLLELQSEDYLSQAAFEAMRPHLASLLSPSQSLPHVQTETFDVSQACNGLATNTVLSRRKNVYPFLLNDFKSFDSLFKVLFIFPSQYLFAIGFP